MGKGTLTIYSASAGSGKTYTLTEIYLLKLFRSRYNYRKILAVTFTNKATAEMKTRILENLFSLASGGKSDYLPVLLEYTGKSEEWIRRESGEILDTILQDFSRFSISTIDSFFQKILRAFTREAGLHSGFNVELDHSTILSSAVDEMLGSAVAGTQIYQWLSSYAINNIAEDKSWNLRNGIINLSQELFRENFKNIPPRERSNFENKDFLLSYIEKLRTLKSSFEKKQAEAGTLAMELFGRYDLTDEMFYYKGRGIPGYVKSLASGVTSKPNSYVRLIMSTPPKWTTGNIHPALNAAISGGLESVLAGAINHYDNHIKDYYTANSILSNIYSLGILSDVLRNIHEITTDENSFLLSDAGEVLSLITGGDQSPFIYEKVGNRYENFMVDEFQDTSTLQWKNIRPLLENSMAEGFDNLVVGDVKQSIYRWRNSDWKILGRELDSLVDNDRFISKPLTMNWRSLSNVIKFNNSVFTSLPRLVDTMFPDDPGQISFSKIYSEAVQTEPKRRDGGYVRIEFVEDDPEVGRNGKILSMLPPVVESLQQHGYEASDIGIIVRDGREGASVLKTFIDYSNSCPAEKLREFNYNVVSGDSLLLSKSHVINFIISVLSAVSNPDDMISRAMMLRYYLLAKGARDTVTVSLESRTLNETSAGHFPAGYEAVLDSLAELPLFEATETIIGFFGLGSTTSDIAYLSTFQDYVVSFSGNKGGDLQSFLEWWETTGCMKSVVMPGNQNAMRILTIHKSKGLEFKVVILPFISWYLDHPGTKQPFLWVRPETAPFNEIGTVPVRYGAGLSETWFASSYAEEKHSVYVDNINLLYVALTRAKEVLYGFSVETGKKDHTIASLLKNAIIEGENTIAEAGIDLSAHYDEEKHLFEFGELPVRKKEAVLRSDFPAREYSVNQRISSLRLKLHGENYFSGEGREVRERINHGKVMHEIFEGIKTEADIEKSVRKAVMDGRIPESESADLQQKIHNLIRAPQVSDWFRPGNEVLTEAGILLPSGNTRRPDRIIFMDGRTLIVDFKFGEEKPHYAEQVERYRALLIEMGYSGIEGYIWYVDKNHIVTV